ncbi:MAG: thioredoxin family protein [Actinomycetota bacterium]
MITRLLVIAGVLAACGAFAMWWRSREGRMIAADGFFEPADVGIGAKERPAAVLVEFSGENCAPCRIVEGRLHKLAGELPDVRVVSIDAGQRLDLADRYRVRRVPTVFVTDPQLHVIWRASGVVSEEALRGALLGPDWAGRPHPTMVDAERPQLRSRGRSRRPRRAKQRTPARPPA